MRDHQNDLTVHRVARNQDTFRSANEEIEAVAQAIGPDLPRVPFICECPETGCSRTMRLRLSEYETIRSDPTHFVVIPGHEVCVVDGEEVARVLARESEYTIMEKVGAAGEEARRLDSRTNSESVDRPTVAERDG